MTKTKHSVPAACSDPGPLNTLLQQFEKHLKTLGYSPHQTLRVNLSAVSHFVCWLNKAGIDLSEVTETGLGHHTRNDRFPASSRTRSARTGVGNQLYPA